MDVEHVSDRGVDCEMDGSSQEVLPPPVKRKRRRRKRTVPKVDESVNENVPQPLTESEVALGTDEPGVVKESVEVPASVEMKSESDHDVPVSADNVDTEIGITASATAEETKISIPANSAQFLNTSKCDLEGPHASEKTATNDLDKQTKTITDNLPSSSMNPPTYSRQETPIGAPAEVKKSPLISRYSRFEFLANSMIITDVTTERGTVTVKECSAYEGFYGPEPDKSS